MISHYHFETVTSTNDYAKQFATDLRGKSQHLPSSFDGAVFTADEQRQGRGRGDHRWYSALNEGMYYSILIPPPFNYQDMASLTTTIGQITVQCIATLTDTTPELEWPNDIILNQKKLGGILIETVGRSQEAAPMFVVIGIGLNLTQSIFPEEIKMSAISLYQATQNRYDAYPFTMALTQAICTALFGRYSGLERIKVA